MAKMQKLIIARDLFFLVAMGGLVYSKASQVPAIFHCQETQKD